MISRHLLTAVGALLFVLAPLVAQAQSDAAKARELYQSCRTLLDEGKACQAVAACEEGLALRDSSTLAELAERANAECKTGTSSGDRKRPRKRCPDGQSITADTAGQCCWAGQAWNGSRCVGTPTTCPDGLTASDAQQACVSGECPQYMVQTNGQCCWPGQAWSNAQNVCLGTPECPVDHEVDGLACRFVSPDTDKDGIVDADDRCVTIAEDPDGFEDDDGCPDSDNDLDEIVDGLDKCPLEAEDLDGFEDNDGCAEEDNDLDEIADVVDECPNDAEDVDGFEDRDGCPDLDNDGDGVPDTVDACPLAAEDINGFDDGDGCPDAASVEREQMLIAGWVLAPAGVALGGTAVVFHVLAQSKRDDVAEVDGFVPDYGDAVSAQDTANTLDTIALTSSIVGGAALVSGVVLLALAYSGDAPAESQVEASILPEGGGHVRWTWRF